jgi:hypothetical protein
MLFVLIGHDAPDAKDKRPKLRPEHLAHLEALAREGRIPLAGPFADGTGSLVVLEADSIEEAWRIVAADPYVRGGVFDRVEVRPFRRVFPKE